MNSKIRRWTGGIIDKEELLPPRKEEDEDEYLLPSTKEVKNLLNTLMMQLQMFHQDQ